MGSKPTGLLQLASQPRTPARPQQCYACCQGCSGQARPGSALPDVRASSSGARHLERQIRGVTAHLEHPGQQNPGEAHPVLLPPRGSPPILLLPLAGGQRDSWLSGLKKKPEPQVPGCHRRSRVQKSSRPAPQAVHLVEDTAGWQRTLIAGEGPGHLAVTTRGTFLEERPGTQLGERMTMA